MLLAPRPRIGEHVLKHMLDREDVAGTTLLLDAGADPAETNGRGETALHWAVWRDRSPAIVALLLARGAPIDARRIDGRTAYAMAVLFGRDALRDTLREAGADTTLSAMDRYLDACNAAAAAGQAPAVRHRASAGAERRRRAPAARSRQRQPPGRRRGAARGRHRRRRARRARRHGAALRLLERRRRAGRAPARPRRRHADRRSHLQRGAGRMAAARRAVLLRAARRLCRGPARADRRGRAGHRRRADRPARGRRDPPRARPADVSC